MRTIEFSLEPPDGEGGVDERARDVESRSQSAPKCAEHELLLGRLAEDAHVRGAAVPDEVARAGRVAAVLGALRVALLRLLDLAARRLRSARRPRRRPCRRAPAPPRGSATSAPFMFEIPSP